MPASDTIEAAGPPDRLGPAVGDLRQDHRAQGVLRDPDVRHRPHQRRRVAHPDADHGARRGGARRPAAAAHDVRLPPVRERDALVKPAEKDRCVPDDFYSTTNHRTHVRLGGQWVEVEQAAHGRGHRRRRRPRRVPQAARREGRRAGGLRPRRHPRDAGVPRARPPRLRVHEQRRLVGAARRRQRRAHRRDDARRQEGRRPHRRRRRPGRRAHRRRRALLRADPPRLRRRGAGRQRAGRARRRVRAVGHVARHRSHRRRAGRAGPPQPHGGDQHDQPRRRHPRRRSRPAC